MAKPRILFVAEAVTLAHVVRPVTLATSLSPAEYDVRFATDPRYDATIGPLPFPVDRVHTIAAEQFARALAHGTPIFGASDYERYVAEDLELIARHRPDVVVGDFRLSLAISARVARVPYINISNAYWSPYARLRNVVPEITLARLAGARVGQAVFDWVRGVGYAAHALPVNRIRRKYGLPPHPLDFRHALADGDVTLYSDVPEIIDVAPLPASHLFAGPIPWSPPVGLPDWWTRASAAPRDRIVYVSLGSSGPPGVFTKVLAALASAPVTVIAASVQRLDPALVPANAYVAPLLPGDQAAALAAAVVCNGGSPTSYQGLAAGRPVVGLATNTDQFLNMAAVEDAGCGKLLRAYRSTPGEIRDAVLEAVDGTALKARAATMAAAIRRYSAVDVFKSALDRVLAARPS